MLALGDDKLVALDNLVPQRQQVWINGEVSVNVSKPFGLETHVALLRIGSQRGRMAQRHDVVTARVCQAHSCGDRLPGTLVGNLALGSVASWRCQAAGRRKTRARNRVDEKLPAILWHGACFSLE